MKMSTQKATRRPATSVRAARMGMANQMAHERDERIERDSLKKKLSDSHAAARKAGAMKTRKAKPGKGMNSGTVGGSWLASFR